MVKLAGKVEPDLVTGQLTTIFDDNPQVPFEELRLHIFGGSRAPLITPPTCGTYTTKAELTPWSGTAPVKSTSTFKVISGPDGGSCPSGALPFVPGLSAGTINSLAGGYSPFVFRLTRSDGTQRFSAFGVSLPPGLLGKLAGVLQCSDAAIAAISGVPGTGRNEIDNSICPAGSQIGRTLAGAGAGSTPLYVPGKVYLAGPYLGAPLSVVAVVPAVAGPFDLGTVVVRAALSLDPVTAQATVVTDPLPQILEGIPLNLRDIRVMVDRPNFTINPTSCDPMSVDATVFGSAGAVANVSNRFQVANCAGLGFKPKLSLQLKGGTKRGGHPKLRAVLKTKQGPDSKTPEANIASAVVRLPRSAFLDQAHIKTICTRVQFAAGGGNGEQCPSRSVYGHASVKTPLLDDGLSGPVYLRSSDHELPDLVIALHGIVDLNVVGRVDSVKGSIRSSFESTPDAPVDTFTLEMDGGSKGLIVNSRNLCSRPSRVKAKFTGQNGALYETQPVLKADCKGKGGKK